MTTTSTSMNGRTPDTLRREIERERRELAEAVEQLREGIGEATNVGAKLRSNLPLVAAAETSICTLADTVLAGLSLSASVTVNRRSPRPW